MNNMKKRVDIMCYRPFQYQRATFAGYCHNVIADDVLIRTALENKAKVTELCEDGKEVALDFANYDENHGGMVPDNTATEAEVDPNKDLNVENITRADARRAEAAAKEKAEREEAKKAQEAIIAAKKAEQAKEEAEAEAAVDVNKSDSVSEELKAEVTVEEDNNNNNDYKKNKKNRR